MSRVHDALRRAENTGYIPQPRPETGLAGSSRVEAPSFEPQGLPGLLEKIQEVPFHPLAESHLIDAARPHEVPSEEFRTLRTRLNHLQSLQPRRSPPSQLLRHLQPRRL